MVLGQQMCVQVERICVSVVQALGNCIERRVRKARSIEHFVGVYGSEVGVHFHLTLLAVLRRFRWHDPSQQLRFCF